MSKLRQQAVFKRMGSDHLLIVDDLGVGLNVDFRLQNVHVSSIPFKRETKTVQEFAEYLKSREYEIYPARGILTSVSIPDLEKLKPAREGT